MDLGKSRRVVSSTDLPFLSFILPSGLRRLNRHVLGCSMHSVPDRLPAATSWLPAAAFTSRSLLVLVAAYCHNAGQAVDNSGKIGVVIFHALGSEPARRSMYMVGPVGDCTAMMVTSISCQVLCPGERSIFASKRRLLAASLTPSSSAITLCRLLSAKRHDSHLLACTA